MAISIVAKLTQLLSLSSYLFWYSYYHYSAVYLYFYFAVLSLFSILIRSHKFNSISVTMFILLSLFVPIFLKQGLCDPSFQTCKPPQLLQSPINSFFVYPLISLFFISYSKIWHISGIPKGYQRRRRIILKWLLLFKHCYGNHFRRTWGGE